MATIEVSIAPEGEEESTNCSCCSRPMYWGGGWLDSTSSTLARYWYRWPEGHQGFFSLAIARFDDSDHLIPGVACFSASVDRENIIYSVLEPADAPWGGFGDFGPLLTREQVLESPDRAEWFSLVDAIAANERRLSERILGCGLRS